MTDYEAGRLVGTVAGALFAAAIVFFMAKRASVRARLGIAAIVALLSLGGSLVLGRILGKKAEGLVDSAIQSCIPACVNGGGPSEAVCGQICSCSIHRMTDGKSPPEVSELFQSLVDEKEPKHAEAVAAMTAAQERCAQPVGQTP